MNWWNSALLAAACWGAQYTLTELLFRKVQFVPAFTALTLATGLMVAVAMFLISPNQQWNVLRLDWSVIGLFALCILFGSVAQFLNAYSIHIKDATHASLLEISYPVFIVLFTALFLHKVHLNMFGLLGMMLMLGGCVLVVMNRGD